MSSSMTKSCFNSNCKDSSDKWWRGWRRRTGEYANLCDRCAAAYEEGKFCETFHLNASGWRCCESCGKQIHCGCIVSFHMFVLLDAGGIECLTCAKKSYVLTPNPAWPPPSHLLPSNPERMKDLSSKSWSSLTGSGSLPWRQAPSVVNGSIFQSDAQPRMPSEINLSGGIDRFRVCERLAAVSTEMKQESFYPGFGLLNGFSAYKTQTDDTHAATMSIHADKHVCCHSGVDSSAEIQVLHGKVVGDGRGHNKLLPRYRPQITHEELQQIASDSKSVITPLFEKMLTASDAGRIGRLVLPKKCAEAYFPPIDHPEGVAIRVHEVKGKDWVFQFRYWPNNNSRMYVLEGITPCIQSMQLQAGDVVTFSRLEPEGKLVIGGRKASTIPSSDPNIREPKLVTKRNSSNFGAKSKRLKIEEDSLELSVTWKEAQGLMRQPDGTVPSVFVVEGWEFEEFEEEAPVIGRPTILWTDNFGEKMQWAQCEDCFKWRKVPADALLQSRWICSGNVWDHHRSLCSAAEELPKEQLEDLLCAISNVPPKKETTEQDADLLALEGLDTLANLATQDEGEGLPSSSETTTKHPRHKPGCACIVCLQPPSGKGFKHKQSCDCVVCGSMKRRFKTLMERREKKQLEKEVEYSSQNLQFQQCSDSPLKSQIDLNIQPEQDEEFSPSSESLPIKRMLLSDV